MTHAMSPTGVAVLLMLALVVDYLSLGPNSIRDRLAFFLALPAIREGFNDGPLDRFTVGALSVVIDAAKKATGGSYIAGAVTSVVLGAAVTCLFIYTIGALLPNKASAKLGRWATISFPTVPMHRINTKLWICATLLALLADLPQGWAGDLIRGAIATLTGWVATVPGLLFGVN
jgi:hypothetical protein